MAKRKRKTKRQKQRIQIRRKQREISGFRINVDKLSSTNGETAEAVKKEIVYKSYLRADLTKTLILTMLAVALELALWFYLK